ncbi:MAG: tol-pal system protein YbgF [Candidatus Latescibacterota bacterium]
MAAAVRSGRVDLSTSERPVGRPPVLRCALLGACLLAGCATQGSVKRMQVDVRRVEHRLEALGEQLTTLDSVLLQRESQSQREWTSLATDGGTLMLRLQQVQARMDEVSRRLADLRQEIELLRLYGVGQAAPGGPSAPATASAPPRAGAWPQSQSQSQLLLADPQSLYEQALADMKAGNHDLAATAFAQFVESFAGDSLADNALYWQGECSYARRDYAGAAAVFRKVLETYPQGDKVPAAMLKLGYSLVESKQREKGAAQLRSLVQKYPDSEEAAQARDRLRNLATPARRRGR